MRQLELEVVLQRIYRKIANRFRRLSHRARRQESDTLPHLNSMASSAVSLSLVSKSDSLTDTDERTNRSRVITIRIDAMPDRETAGPATSLRDHHECVAY